MPTILKPGALVLGGDYRALGVVRSLAPRRIPVWIVQEHDRLAGKSRLVSRRLRWPEGDDDARVDFLQRLAADHALQGWVLFPTTDETAAMISRNHDRLSASFSLTTSPWPAHSAATNKAAMHAVAAGLGIDHPRTVTVASVKRLDDIDLSFPMILKPAERRGRNDFTDAKAWQVNNRAELTERFTVASALVGAADVMVQELIPGDGSNQLSFAAVCDDGVPRAWLTAVRLRQFPIDFGRSSTFVTTADLPEIIEPARRLLAELRISGPVEVEFKRDVRDGSVKVLDVNARVWGWHSLAADAGVDISYAAWLVAQGRAVEPCIAKPGVRWTRLSTDLPVALSEIRAKRLSVRSFLRSVAPPVQGPIALWSDPLPALTEVPMHALSVLRRRLARNH